MSDERLSRQVEALAKVVETIAARPVKHGKHGLPGRDGIGIPGRDGRDGKDVDPDLVVKRIDEIARVEVAKIPVPKDGRDGKDVPLEVVAELVDAKAKEYVALIPIPKDGVNGIGIQGPPGPRGIPGPQGDDGDIGPMPRHEWESTRLRFEIEPGKWGRFVELRGPKGARGDSGALTAMGLPIGGGGGGGGSSSTTTANGYFPMGWQ